MADASPEVGKADSKTVMAAIKCVGDTQLHCGLVVSLTDEEQRIIHLAWHHDLRVGPFEGGYFCYDVGLDIINQVILADFALLVAEKNQNRVPYGFEFKGMRFDAATGNLDPIPLGKGLTCATFVFALLNSIDLPPVNIDSWENSPADDDWRVLIINSLQVTGASQGHIDAIKVMGNPARVKPEEIVAAVSTSSDRWPLEWAEIQPPSEAIRTAVLTK